MFRNNFFCCCTQLKLNNKVPACYVIACHVLSFEFDTSLNYKFGSEEIPEIMLLYKHLVALK